MKRSLLRSGRISLLNMAGLSAGLAAAILIYTWVVDELQYDRWIADHDRVFRVEALMNFTGDPFVWVQTQAPLMEALISEFPEVESGTRLKSGYNESLRIGEEIFVADNFWYAAGDVVELFGLKVLRGNPEVSLNEPASVILSESMARKYYGASDPVGSVIVHNDNEMLTVRGVVADVPANSHIRFDYLVSFSDYESKYPSGGWGQFNYANYIKLRQGASAASFNDKLEGYMQTKKKEVSGRLYINPVTRLYLYRDPGFESIVYPSTDRGPIGRVILFSIIGAIIIAVSLINFISLSTSVSSDRAAEIALKKINGASRRELVVTLFGESLLQSVISVIIAVAFAVSALPLFESVTGKDFDVAALFTPGNLLLYILTALLAGLITGLYPALMLSSISPLRAMKNEPGGIVHGSGLRKVLVVLQIIITVVFIFCVAVISLQIRYIDKVDLGFDADRIMILKSRVEPAKYQAITEILEGTPGVEGVANCGVVPVNMGNWSTINRWEGNDGDKSLKFHMMQVDEKYFDLMRFELAQGRQLRGGEVYNEVIINEAAVRQMGIENPIGKRIKHGYYNEDYTIIGIVRDFHFRRLSDEINPVFMFRDREWYSTNFYVKLEPGAGTAVVESVNGIVGEFTPGLPLISSFLDEKIAACYSEEVKLSRLVRVSALLSILISAIGLFSLTSHTVIKRRREIGIRKVNGASLHVILTMLLRENWWLAVIASAIALPVATVVSARWLSGYAYHIGIDWVLYPVVLIVTMMITTLTILFHAVKASGTNPAAVLRESR